MISVFQTQRQTEFRSLVFFAFYLYVSIVLPHNFTHISKSYTVAILVTVIGMKTGPENTFPGMSGNTRSVVFDRNQ